MIASRARGLALTQSGVITQIVFTVTVYTSKTRPQRRGLYVPTLDLLSVSLVQETTEEHLYVRSTDDR